MAPQSFARELGFGLGHTILGSGLVAIVDWLGNRQIDYPYDDLALGSGMACGYNFYNEHVGGVAASLAGFSLAIVPEIAKASAGDFASAGTNLAIRAVEYTMGAVFGYIGASISKS